MIAKILLAALFSCDPALTGLFTPLRPTLGRYEVCTTADTIETVVADGGADRPHFARIETVQAIDAFGGAGTYDRSALARLYGGRRVDVARGWSLRGDRFESVTLISPYPDASLAHLMPGTMVIRWRCELRAAACQIPAA